MERLHFLHYLSSLASQSSDSHTHRHTHTHRHRHRERGRHSERVRETNRPTGQQQLDLNDKISHEEE